MRKTLARWLRTLARRLDPSPQKPTVNVFNYFGEPSTTATTFARQLRYHVENKEV